MRARDLDLPSTGNARASVDVLVDEWLADAPPDAPVGTVTLVGAGPGDPELLTLKAARALAQTRLALYDHLVSPAVLDFLPFDARRIYVGKEASRHTLPQAGIAHLMVKLARAGHSLARLKGGDGYIFGRGGEEVQALAAAGIPFRVIPGLTAAQGAAASTGIPLTHRDHAGALVLATGHRRGDQQLDMDWPMLARPHQTVVLYMGVSNLPEICRQLLAHGLPATTPAALIENATLPEERCVTGALTDLPGLARQHQIRPPALIMIGDVVAARQQPKPLMAAARELSAQTALSA